MSELIRRIFDAAAVAAHSIFLPVRDDYGAEVEMTFSVDVGKPFFCFGHLKWLLHLTICFGREVRMESCCRTRLARWELGHQ